MLLRIFVVFDFVFVKINEEIGGSLMLFGFGQFLLKMLLKYSFFYLVLINFFVVFVWILPRKKFIMFVYYLFITGNAPTENQIPDFQE